MLFGKYISKPPAPVYPVAEMITSLNPQKSAKAKNYNTSRMINQAKLAVEVLVMP